MRKPVRNIKHLAHTALLLLVFFSVCVRSNAQIHTTNTGGMYVSSGTIVAAIGDFTNNSTGAFQNNGLFYIKGNLSNAQASMLTGTGTLTFNGTLAQVVNGTQPFKTFNLTTNNSAGITINNNLSLSGSHIYTSGMITTSATPNYLIYEAGASYAGDADSRHVNGWIKKIGSTNFVFPVGSALYERTVSLTSLSVTGEFNVKYSINTPGRTTLQLPLVAVDTAEYWIVNKVTGGSASLALNWDDSKVNFPNWAIANIRAAYYNGTTWSNAGGTASGNVLTTGTITSNSVSSFNYFTFAKVGADADGDGITDVTDIDDDNDGIPDVIEVCGTGATSFSCTTGSTDPSADNDYDGVPNYQDADWGTLNVAGCNAALDTDIDGVPDYLDLDSDNDGIPDVAEAWGVDADGDGRIDNFTDTDSDGLSQNVDANNTGAAGSGNGLGFIDYDGDGIENSADLDSDNDGIPDIIEAGGTDSGNDGMVDSFSDADGDGLTSAYDGDADNNGVIENTIGPLLKTGADTNNDGRADSNTNKNIDRLGRPNPYDLDSDGDGITDMVEAGFAGTAGIASGIRGVDGWSDTIDALASLNLPNTDGRGNPNYLDIDSDDDGISDNVEGQPTYSNKIATDTDVDNDGLADIYEVSAGTFGGNGITPYDHDGDGTPDYKDTDTDNDGAPDINECSKLFTLTQANITITDTDGDGLVDHFDNIDISTLTAGTYYMNVSNSNMGTNGDFNGPYPSGSNVKLVKSQITGGDRDWRSTSILPLQVVSFTGNLQNSVANLKWVAENETQTDHYIIERSFDEVQFDNIGSVNAFNTGTATYTYKNDLTGKVFSTVYYRVKQVNKSGRIFVTSIIQFRPNGYISTTNVFPNPATDHVTISIQSLIKDKAEVVIMDASGNVVLSKNYDVEKGTNNLLISEIKSFAAGLYVVKVKTKDQVQAEKLVKK